MKSIRIFYFSLLSLMASLSSVKVQSQSCPLLTHSSYATFNSSANAGTATTLWLSVHTSLNGELSHNGDSLTFTSGSLTLTNIGTLFGSLAGVSDGTILATNTVTTPVTSYDAVNDKWLTKVPLSYHSNDIFISGTAINSGTGFVAAANHSTTLRGILCSNISSFVANWFYSMSCYQPVFTNSTAGSVNVVNNVPVNGRQSGTPNGQITHLVSGASGSGGSNYTGNNSSNDRSFQNQNACPGVTHKPFNDFTASLPAATPTTLWLNIRIHMHGRLIDHGDYIMYTGGLLKFTNIGTSFGSTVPVSAGKVIADSTVSAPTTSYDALNDIWTTRVAPKSGENDIFISGTAITSTTGFTVSANHSTTLSGVFCGNVRTFRHHGRHHWWWWHFSWESEWKYALACYQPTFTTATVGSVNAANNVPLNHYDAGTPTDQLGHVVVGGSSDYHGGPHIDRHDYTGHWSSDDHTFACAFPQFDVCPISQSVCVGKDNVNFNYVLAESSTAAVDWTLNGNPISPPASGPATLAMAGVYVITATNNCGSDTCSFTITVVQ